MFLADNNPATQVSVGLAFGLLAVIVAVYFFFSITGISLPTGPGQKAERERMAANIKDDAGKPIGTAEDFERWFDRVEKLQNSIHLGAKSFLFAEYFYLLIFCIVVAAALCGVLYQESAQTAGVFTAICFLAGAFLSGAAGYVGMVVATEANSRTAYKCADSMKAGLEVSFASGAVMSNSVVGFGIVGVSVLYLIFSGDALAWQYLSGFGFGASAIALFARVGGGIFTKAADVGADLVGKVDSGIPEDDFRNPATIADNVGDNVGDVAGMGADLFESFVGGIIATATLAVNQSTGELQQAEVALPFWVAGFGIGVALIGTVIVRTVNIESNAGLDRLLAQINYGIFTSAFLVIITSLVACGILFGWEQERTYRYFGCIVIGLVAGLIVGQFTEYCTSYEKAPTRYISESAKFGTAPVIIMGLGVGMISVTVPTIALSATILACNALGGLYGISLSSVGLLATLGITLATDAYGPVADNAGGIAEMAGMHDSIRARTDALDSLGNTTAATGKGFAIGSAVLTSVGLIAAFLQQSGVVSAGGASLGASLDKPVVLTGVLIGAMLPFVFAALTMLSVNKAAQAIIAEVRRQFSKCPELLRFPEGSPEIYKLHKGVDGQMYPDSATCVKIAATSAVAEMVLPGVAAIFSPVIIGFLMGTLGLAGLLVGALSSGFMLALTMSNAGGAWDNAKKWVEKCAKDGDEDGKFTKYGIKKGSVFDAFKADSVESVKTFAPIGDTDASAAAISKSMTGDKFTTAALKTELMELYHTRHSAVVNGDTVGDPFKDTSGPALNILIKLMSVISLVLAPAFKSLNEHEGFGPTGWWLALIVFVVISVVCYIFMGCVDKANAKSEGELEASLAEEKLTAWKQASAARKAALSEITDESDDVIATAVDAAKAAAIPALVAGANTIPSSGPEDTEATKHRVAILEGMLPIVEDKLKVAFSPADRASVLAEAEKHITGEADAADAADVAADVEDEAPAAAAAAAADADAAEPGPVPMDGEDVASA